MARGRFRSLSVSETVYRKLKEIAERRGFSTLADTVAYLVSLEELVASKLESINVTRSSGNNTTSAGNVTRSSGNNTTSAGNVASRGTTRGKTGSGGEEGRAGEGHEWCWSKAKVRSLQDFLRWIDGRFGLLDWWDEGDRYCFQTERRPAKTE
jgi:predicted DNA-binding ribbon-helix-helix protein